MEPPPLPSQNQFQGSTGSRICFIFNGYVILFAADGAFALLRSVLGDALHTIAGSFAVVFALLVIVLVSSYRHLPWKCLAPALVFSIWEGCLFLPLPAFAAFDTLINATAGLNLLISAGTFIAIRRMNAGRSVLFQQESLNPREFSFQRTLITGGLQLFVLTPAMIVYVLWSFQLMVKEVSAGFIQVTSQGLFTEARIYECGGQKIYLLPTVHIASPKFYDTLMADLPAENTVILPEGVSDNQHLLKAKADYSQAADAMGLHAQPDLTQKKKHAAVQPCDADISDFKPSTIEILNGVFGAIQSASSGDLLGALTLLQSFSETQTPALIEDILQTRNARVVESIRQALPKYGHIAVPWGAAHMPGIERGLHQLSASHIDSRRVEVLRWSELTLFPQP